MLTSLGLDQQANSPEDPDACLSLTVKERLILQEVAQGQSNSENSFEEYLCQARRKQSYSSGINDC